MASGFIPYFTPIDENSPVRGYASDVLRIDRDDIMDNDGFMILIVPYLL